MLMKLNLPCVRLYIRGHRSESALYIYICVCIYKVQVNCTNLHKNRERAWCHTCMDSANRQHLEGGLEPMLELKDWTLLSEISSDTQNMYRGGRWLNTSHDGGPDGKTSPSNCNWSVSTSGEGGGGTPHEVQTDQHPGTLNYEVCRC